MRVPSRKLNRACTNLEAVQLWLDCSAQATDVHSLRSSKLVSLEILDTDRLMPDKDRFFSFLSNFSALEETHLRVSKLLPEALLRKIFECVKSAPTLTCIINQCDANPAKDNIGVIACN